MLRRYGPFIGIVVVIAVVVVVVVATSGGGAKPAPTTVAGASTTTASQGQDCGRQATLGPTATCKPLFTGDNGGATYTHGVTKDAVTVEWYTSPVSPQVQQLLESAGLSADPSLLAHTIDVFSQYFNQNFQTYGRKVDVKIFNSQIDPTVDPAGTRADGVKLDEEEHAFMSLGSNTAEFLDESARRGLVSLGGNQFPSTFYTEHAPYVFSLLPDADRTNEHIAQYISKKFGPTSTAQFAGAGSQGLPRRYGIVYPATGVGGAPSSYAAIGDDLFQRMTKLGLPVDKPIGYASDINTALQQSTSIIRQLADAKVTTVICLCDLISPRFLGNVATQQNYFPEWFESGYLLQDTDFAGRLYDQKQWSHAFGISTLAVANTTGGNDPNSPVVMAWKSIDPTTDPPAGSAIPFTYMLVAFSGIELAGPKLDQATFAQGLDRLKIVSKAPDQVSYSYTPTDYGGSDDAQEIWWDADALAPGDQKKGHWQSVDAGYRYFPDQWPTGVHVFDKACLPAGTCGGPTYH